MKTITLTLSDSAHRKALEIATSHNVPIEAYLSTEVEDVLDGKTQVIHTHRATVEIGSPNKPRLRPNFSSVLPDTLKQVFEVCKYVYRTRTVPKDEVHANAEYKDAVRSVAAQFRVTESTVRDKCGTTRRLGLSDVPVTTGTFVKWLCEPEALQNHLCRKFPNSVAEIRERFAGWLPGRFGAN